MSSFRAPAAQTGASGDADVTRSPRRKASMDIMRIKNFPSSLSLRKPDPDTPPRADASSSSSGGTFSRFRAFSQSRPSRASLGAEQADTSTDPKASKRSSRLLDAFKSTKKPAPSFEVVRKPPNRSTTSFHSSHQPTPHAEVQRPESRLSVHKPPEILEPAPRISLSAPQHEGAPQLVALNNGTATAAPTQDGLNSRAPYPPSTTRTRRISSGLSASNIRKLSDSYLGAGSTSNSRAQSPSASPIIDPTAGSFNLHSFRNVRSTSDVSSAADDPSPAAHSRVHSIISVDEYVTPGEEIPEPRYVDEPSSSSNLDAIKSNEAIRAQSSSPAANPRPLSISAAKFRQAARQRSESGTIPTMDTIQGGSGFARPPRSRTPSQDLAAMEAVLAQTHQRVYADRRKSADLATLSPSTSALGLTEEPLRRKRGFFIVVEGLDRAGKSTQVERLAEHLNAKAIKFPERTTAIGVMINSYLAQTSDLDDQAIHLLFSANRWECAASIKNTLEAGQSIVCDRYAFSGIAYSVAKGLAYDWCRNPDVGLPLPDLTMFLDLDAQTAAARGGYGEERYEKLEFQAKVREAFTRVSQDVKSHGGRWVTIDASKTLDQVTEDINKAVQRATSSIDRVGAKLGKLFVSERPANVRAGSSNELLPPSLVVPNVKRASVSSDDSGRRGKSLDQPRIQVNTGTTNGTFPASRPSGSPNTYTAQLASIRSAAAGTLSGFFGGSNATLDQQNPSPQAEVDGPSPTNAARGQGFDSARVLGRPDGHGRRRTLIDVIGEIETQQQPATPDHRRSLSASSPTLQSPADGFLSTFAQAGRVRRSTDHGGSVTKLPTIASNGEAPMPPVAPRTASLTAQPAGNSTAPSASPDARPSASPSSMRASSFSSAMNDNLAPRPSPSGLSPNARPPASPAITTSSRSSLASPPLPATTPPIPRPASAAPAPLDYDPNSLLSSQHLSMLNVQQGQAEMQEQYMRNYMAMMANPMLAQQAHYQMMLQRHQQQYYGRAASAIGVGANGNGVPQNAGQAGGPPLAAFMQPSAQSAVGLGERERARSTHKRTQSSTSLLDNSASQPSATSGSAAATAAPMLSMMMAPPPPSASSPASPTIPSFAQQQYYPYPPPQQQQQMMYGQQQMFYSNGMSQAYPWAGMQGRPGYAANTTRSEIVTPSSGGPGPIRNQRSSERSLRAQQREQQQQQQQQQ